MNAHSFMWTGRRDAFVTVQGTGDQALVTRLDRVALTELLQGGAVHLVVGLRRMPPVDAASPAREQGGPG